MVNNETPLVRTISQQTGTRLRKFRDEVRQRDGGCIMTGIVSSEGYHDQWTVFDAAHIFPLAYEGYWREHNFSRWITIPSANGDSINSKQNGILLRKDIHSLFDNYSLSINPDVRKTCDRFLF